MSYNLTNEERRIAISQLTSMDVMNSTIGAAKLNPQVNYRIVPIPPKNRGEPKRWVAVEPLSHSIKTDVRQPDPDKPVLCASLNQYGCACYCYGDKLSCYIITSIVFTVIFSIITTPLLLLCCVPMIINLVKARRDVEEGDEAGARDECNTWLCWFIGAFTWALVGAIVVAVALPLVIIFVIIN